MKGHVSERILLVSLLMLIAITVACAPAVAPTKPVEKPSIVKPSVVKVGYMEDMTSIYAAIGKGHLPALQAKIAEINAGGGIDGVPLELVWTDAAQDAALSVSAYRKFKQEGCMLVGTLSTLHANAIVGMATEDKMSLLCFASGTDLFFPPTPYMWSQIGNHASWNIATLVPFNNWWKKQYGVKPWKLGILFMEHPMTLPSISGIEVWCKKNNVEIVGIEKTPMTALEYKTELGRLRDKGANAILLGGMGRWPCIRDMGELGMLPGLEITIPDKQFIWHDGGITPLATTGEIMASGWQVAGKWAKYCLANRADTVTITDPAGKPELQKMFDAQKQAFGKLDPIYNAPYNWGWTWGVVAKAALAKAVKEVGWDKMTPAAISERGLPNLTVEMGGLYDYPLSTADYPGDRCFLDYLGPARFNDVAGEMEWVVPASQWFNTDKYCWDNGIYEPYLQQKR